MCAWFSVFRTWCQRVGPCLQNPLQRQQRHLTTTTGHRCRSKEVHKPSKAQGGARIPWGDLAGWCVLIAWDAFVCGVCLCAFCGVVLPGCVVWAEVVGGLYFPSPYPAMHNVQPLEQFTWLEKASSQERRRSHMVQWTNGPPGIGPGPSGPFSPGPIFALGPLGCCRRHHWMFGRLPRLL